MKTWIVRTLLHLYPKAWRREYGPELMDVLLAQPLTAGIVGNVLYSGLRQRVRTAEPSTFLGLVLMLVVLAGFVWKDLILSPQTSNLYVLILLGGGVWTHLRHRGELSQSGRAAVKISFMGGIPVMAAGVLMIFGIVGVHGVQNYCWIRVSDPSSPLRALQSAVCPPAPLGVLISPLFLLPVSWLWGLGGGALGREIARRWSRPVTNS